MKRIIILIIPAIVTITNSGYAQQGFTCDDTVCVNQQLLIQNFDPGAQSWYYSVGNLNLGSLSYLQMIPNINGLLNTSAYGEIIFDGTNYILFRDNYAGEIIRYNLGTNPFNPSPVVTNLGNMGGILPVQLQGIQILQESGAWYGFVVGYYNLIRLDFGTSLTNMPAATALGNLNFGWPHDLTIVKDSSTWYGFAANRFGWISRFTFGNSLANTPVSLPQITGFNDEPCNIALLKENGSWYALVSELSNSTALTRLDFGSSLANTPASVIITHPSFNFNTARGVCLIRTCSQLIGLVGDEMSQVFKLDFTSGITSSFTVTVLNEAANGLLRTHKFLPFWYNTQLYILIPNTSNTSATNDTFFYLLGQTGSTSMFSNIQTPTYSFPSAGTYTINYIMNTGRGDQYSQCKNVTVETCTGIDEIKSDNKILVIPNPFKNEFDIIFQIPGFGNASLTIKNIFGQTVFKQFPDEFGTGQTISNNLNHQTSIDLSFLQSGIYFLEIISGDDKIVRKIVKQ